MLVLALTLGLLAPSARWDALCTPCHGTRGDGPAAASMWPRPTDLTGPLKLGDAPATLARVIDQGVPGTAMPAFGSLPAAERAALVAELLALRGGSPESPPPAPPPPPDLARATATGAVLWRRHGCAACHDQRPPLVDARGLTADWPDLRHGELKGGATAEALFASITAGRPGTPMPGFAALPAGERWALVAWLLAGRGPVRRGRRPPPAGLPAAVDPLWPPGPWADDRLEGLPILATGAAQQCGRCHPSQAARWAGSRHAQARGPGLLGQYHGRDAAFQARCDACHGPVAGGLDAVGCAACHVRDHQKLGRGQRRDDRPLPGVAFRVEPRLGRADFCLPCHQLPPEAAVDGRPLLDTWREWAASPYLPAGVQCQHCHVPAGDHAFAGAHDPGAVRRAVRLDAQVQAGEPVVVRVEVHNVGAGHHFPTTATPRGVLRVRLWQGGAPTDAERLWAIGRTMAHEGGRWVTIADTRIAAGGHGVWVARLPRGDADRVEVSLSFFPDWHYARVFRGAVAALPPGAPAATDLAAALQAAESSGFLVEERYLDLP